MESLVRERSCLHTLRNRWTSRRIHNRQTRGLYRTISLRLIESGTLYTLALIMWMTTIFVTKGVRKSYTLLGSPELTSLDPLNELLSEGWAILLHRSHFLYGRSHRSDAYNPPGVFSRPGENQHLAQ